jgi:hypothetical protein
MTIIKRAGLGYAAIAAVCLVLVSWLGYHEFVEEPKEFAERGVPELHKDVSAELSTVIFLAAVPALLGVGSVDAPGFKTAARAGRCRGEN